MNYSPIDSSDLSTYTISEDSSSNATFNSTPSTMTTSMTPNMPTMTSSMPTNTPSNPPNTSTAQTSLSTSLGLTSKKPNAIKTFLNDNKGTLLMAAMGLSIGFAFKDFVKEFIDTVINSIVYISTKKSIGGSLHFNAFKLFNSFISLILVIIIDYYIYKLI